MDAASHLSGQRQNIQLHLLTVFGTCLSSSKRGWRGLWQGLLDSGPGRSSLGIPKALGLPQGAEVLRAPHLLNGGFSSLIKLKTLRDPSGDQKWSLSVLGALQKLLNMEPCPVFSFAIKDTRLWVLAENPWKGKPVKLSEMTPVW